MFTYNTSPLGISHHQVSFYPSSTDRIFVLGGLLSDRKLAIMKADPSTGFPALNYNLGLQEDLIHADAEMTGVWVAFVSRSQLSIVMRFVDETCDKTCKTCNYLTKICTACFEGYEFPPLTDPLNCQKITCHPSCLTCSGNQINHCLSCDTSVNYLDSGTGRCLAIPATEFSKE